MEISHMEISHMESGLMYINDFLDDEILSINEFGDGHINDTILVETQSGRYVAQRIESGMDISKLEYNYKLYSEVFVNHDWLYPKWIKDKKGSFFGTDPSGGNWRMYKYLDGTVLDESVIASSEDDHVKDIIYSYGQGLAKFHGILRNIKEKPQAVYPDLHNLRKYYEEYLRIKNTGAINEIFRDYDIEKQLEYLVECHIMQKSSGNIFSIVHGDPKLSNVLFRDGSVIGFLDMDTIMWGSLLDDIADAIRSCCIIDGKVSIGFMEIFMNGYTSDAPKNVVEHVDKNLHEAFAKICTELALRYYTDEISGAGYFKEKYPGYRIKRTRELLKLII